MIIKHKGKQMYMKLDFDSKQIQRIKMFAILIAKAG
jgi:hypothetical protein